MSYFEKCDFLSFSPTLLINGNGRMKTTLGGILSIIIFCVTLMSVYFFSLDMVMRRNPTVSFNKYFSENENFLLTKQSFFIMFGVRFNTATDLEDPKRFFEAKALRYYYESAQDEEGNPETITHISDVPVRPCNAADTANHPEHQNMPLEKYYCLDDDASVEMFAPLAGPFDNSYLNLYLRPCQADVAQEGGFECASKEEFDNLMVNTAAFLRFETYYVDHDSYEDPVKSYVETIYSTNHADIYNRTNIGFGKLNYQTDDGLLFEQSNTLEYFVYQEHSAFQYSMAEKYKAIKETFHQITLTFSKIGLHDNYRRSYKKIQNVMADIGGFSKGCMGLAYAINILFSKSAFLSLIFTDSFLCFYKDVGQKGDLCLNPGDKSNLELKKEVVLASKAVKIGSTDIKRAQTDSFTFLKALLKCKQSTKSAKAKRMAECYDKLMDVRTLITVNQKLDLLGNALLSPTERNVFRSLDFLLELEAVPRFGNIENKLKNHSLFMSSKSVDPLVVDKFLSSKDAQMQNYIDNN